jgi:hypothetical protein
VRLPRLLRVEAIIASEEGYHDEAILLIKKLRDARIEQYRCPPDPIEVLRDSAAAVQVRLRAGDKTKNTTQWELSRIQKALTDYLGNEAPICKLISDIRERVSKFGSRAPPIIA